jgi:hypothetical protein
MARQRSRRRRSKTSSPASIASIASIASLWPRSHGSDRMCFCRRSSKTPWAASPREGSGAGRSSRRLQSVVQTSKGAARAFGERRELQACAHRAWRYDPSLALITNGPRANDPSGEAASCALEVWRRKTSALLCSDHDAALRRAGGDDALFQALRFGERLRRRRPLCRIGIREAIEVRLDDFAQRRRVLKDRAR